LKLPHKLQDFYEQVYKMAASGATLTYCKRELMHKIWELLLDEEFMHAYEHGIIIKCVDGILRRVFPRFFTYSADYPEKYALTKFTSEPLANQLTGFFSPQFDIWHNAHVHDVR